MGCEDVYRIQLDHGPMASFCAQGNEPQGFNESGQFPDYLSSIQPVKWGPV